MSTSIVDNTIDLWRNFLSPEFGTNWDKWKYPYFWRYPNFFITQYTTGGNRQTDYTGPQSVPRSVKIGALEFSAKRYSRLLEKSVLWCRRKV